jgi:hypothetical protein
MLVAVGAAPLICDVRRPKRAIFCPSNKHMKSPKAIHLRAAIICLVSLPLLAMMFPEDTIGTSDWSQWTKREKLIFLTGFRLGSGPFVHSAPATTDKPLRLSKGHYEDVVKRMDSFYGEKLNKDVTIHGAIEIVLMQMNDVPEEAVAKKLEMERTRKGWGF